MKPDNNRQLAFDAHEAATCSGSLGYSMEIQVRLYNKALRLWQEQIKAVRKAHKATYIEKEIIHQCLSHLGRLQKL